MAEAIVLAVAGILGSLAVGKLETMAKEKFVHDYGLLVGVQAEAQKLQPKLTLIKPVLPDAELKQINNPSVKEWMESLKQIMYDAEDVLDEWHTRVSIFQSQITEASDFSRKLFSFLSSKYCSCFEPFLPLLFGNNFQLLSVRIDIARRMQGITRSLDDLCASIQQLKLISNDTHRDTYIPPRQSTSSMVDVSEVYGRDNDKKTIVRWLLSGSSEQKKEVPVISIVGTGGFGKTTLAKLVLEDVDVVTAFGRNIWWTCVSEPFDRERVASEIIEAATGTKPDVGAWQVLQQRLSESVRGKRFLLVLDDVWSKDPNDWDDLKIALAGGEQGSRIVITTRDSKVAQMMGCTGSRTHELKQLSDDGCWSLFRSIAFWGRSEDEIARLEGTGKELTKKCRGVPLAVKTLASHMRGERTIKDWKNVLNNEIWKVKHDTFFPALLLSYHALPSSLKQCFTYCSVFPKGTVMCKDKLVKLWMAHGFLESDGRKELEMVGTEYFDNLAMASFFQDFIKNYVDGSIVFCKMHDLIHDFAQFLSGKESCVTGVHDQRTLIAWRGQWDTSWKFNRLTCLRSLVLERYKHNELPSEVGSLLHLRYLDLSQSEKLEELPDTLCNLYNLQTLILFGCDTLRKLPEEIGKLSNLRHLDIRYTKRLYYFPQSIGRLSKLRTLSKFIVSGATASKGCKIGELESLNHLSGTLQLAGLRHVGSMDEAKRAEMLNKKNLSCLELNFEDSSYFSLFSGPDEDDDGMKRQESVLEGLQPDVNLEGLVIINYQGSIFPCLMFSESLLPNLVKIELKYCKNCSELPPLGKFKYLEKLHIESFKSVKRITSQFYGAGVGPSFPKLKELWLIKMEGLEDWEIPFSNFEKVMPRLFSLVLWNCPKLMELPALGRLESLEEIRLNGLDSVKRVGTEFLGASCSSGEEEVVFPNLRKLDFNHMLQWAELDLPSALCNLRNLSIRGCIKLKTMTLTAALSKLRSLETLDVGGLDGVKNVRADILGISYDSVVISATGDGESSTTSSSPDLVLFPNLTKLTLGGFPEWEEDGGDEITTCTIFPVLQELEIGNCKKLKVVPHYLFSRSLREITLQRCPRLTGTQPCLPPLVEKLELKYDVGILSNSLLPIITNGYNNDGNSYPNLKSVTIRRSRHSSLPQGLNKFTSLQYLDISDCRVLDLKPEEELRYFPMLRSVSIKECSTIEERYNREDWGNNLSRQIPFNASFDELDFGGYWMNRRKIITLEKVK